MADQLSIPVEIIVIDDASQPEFIEANKQLTSLVNQYHHLPENIGRSRIRNSFLQYAKYDYCLFLDCDVMPAKEDFLSVYVKALELSPMVIYGGRIFPIERPDKKGQLRWKYGIEIESKPAELRNIDPYRYFHSNNFLIRKSIFQQIQFDESLTGYGYEDSLFSYQLQQAGIAVMHIDNPVLNLQIESTEQYLDNIDQSLQSLAAIRAKFDIGKTVRLAKFYDQYEWLLTMLPAALVQQVRRKLLKGELNLRLLQLYKLLRYKLSLRDKGDKG
jgi:cellulose synthase/poly-beta-1,6-N-acetylglucosamine synthase-like glycosyltransferase